MNILVEFNGIVGLITAILMHPFILMMMGLITHFVKAMAEIKKGTGITMTPRMYYFQNPWHTILSFVGAFVGYAFFIGDEDLSKLSDTAANALRANAFFVGYMADSVIDMIGQRSTVGKPKEETKP